MSQTTYAFVDIETTGSSPSVGRITEVAIILMRDHQVIDTFQTLVNPETAIPPFITKVTGIDDAMVEMAPTFAAVAPAVWEKLQDCVFVAHNVNFDYGFLKNEFKRVGLEFTADTLCTVKLSRQLYPEHSRHGLDALIERFDLDVENRHRALDDCQLMIDLWALWHQSDAQKLLAAVAQQLRGPILPKNLPATALDDLPATPGVYYFYAENDPKPLYVGRGTNIKKRVLKHFSGDHLSAKQTQMLEQIYQVEHTKTTGALGAMLQEIEQIKTLQPLYNRALRRAETFYTLDLQETTAHNLVEIKEIEPEAFISGSSYYGCFRSAGEAKKVLQKFVTEQGLCEALLGMNCKIGPCSFYETGVCKGACADVFPAIQYNFILQQALAKYKLKNWWFSGPIAVKEHCAEQERTELHFFDQWCYLGTLEAAAESALDLSVLQTPKFDVDYYKILQRFFRQSAGADIEIIKLKALS